MAGGSVVAIPPGAAVSVSPVKQLPGLSATVARPMSPLPGLPLPPLLLNELSMLMLPRAWKKQTSDGPDGPIRMPPLQSGASDGACSWSGRSTTSSPHESLFLNVLW